MKWMALLLLLSVFLAACSTAVDTGKSANTEAGSMENIESTEANTEAADTQNTDIPASDSTSEPVLSVPSESSRITLAELGQHNTASDCWVAYQGDVYDITAWLPKHPGSPAAIMPYCGTASEFEQAFEGKHGTSKVQKLREEGQLMGSLA